MGDALAAAIVVTVRALVDCAVFACAFVLLRHGVGLDETWALGLSVVLALGGRPVSVDGRR